MPHSFGSSSREQQLSKPAVILLTAADYFQRAGVRRWPSGNFLSRPYILRSW